MERIALEASPMAAPRTVRLGYRRVELTEVEMSKTDPLGKNSIPPDAKTHRTSPIEQKTQASRPVSSGVVKRGDRRDTHPRYSTGKNKMKNGGRPPAADRTRKR
ncbi:MAG: hypothetical protein QM770_02140 [Tepidisphaeraceae bacterium]